MKQYIGDRFDRVAGSLTADDCYEIIAAAIQDTQTAEKYSQTIADFEAARYASIETNLDTTKVKELINLVRTVEKKTKKWFSERQ